MDSERQQRAPAMVSAKLLHRLIESAPCVNCGGQVGGRQLPWNHLDVNGHVLIGRGWVERMCSKACVELFSSLLPADERALAVQVFFAVDAKTLPVTTEEWIAEIHNQARHFRLASKVPRSVRDDTSRRGITRSMYVVKLVKQFPPLTEAQRDRLKLLLSGVKLPHPPAHIRG